METYSNFLIITFNDPDAGSIPVAVCESIGWFLGNCSFPAIFFLFFMPTCPSWSKGADLRSAVFARVGSNPTVGKADEPIWWR
jgi:hypothetical protein